MSTCVGSWRCTKVGGRLLTVVVGTLAVTMLASTAEAAGSGGATSSAERLVAEALQAEAAGEPARRDALIDEALRVKPDFDLARWSRGEVHSDGKWLPVEEAQQANATDPRRLEYLSLREAYGNQPAAQLELARWCRRNDLNEEARIHWANVLSFNPANEEALRALGADWFRGRLMTYAQIDRAKRELHDSRQATKKWGKQLTKWQRMFAAGDIASRNAALDEVRAVSDPNAIAVLEDATLYADIETTPEEQQCLFLSRAFVDALGQMPDPSAAAALARHAVLSRFEDVRTASIERLRERPMIDYVPLLLDALAMPVESVFQVTTDPDGSIHYRHSLYIDGRQADWSLEDTRSLWQVDLGGRRTLIGPDGLVSGYSLAGPTDAQAAMTIAAVAGQSQQRFANQAVGIERQVAQANEAAAEWNKRIIPVLVKTTGEELGDNPQDWWSWWERYTEYDTSERKPVHERRYSESDRRYYRPPSSGYGEPNRGYEPPKFRPVPPPKAPRTRVTGPRPNGRILGTRPKYPISCFPRGTLVWTNTGQRAIETIEIGDLVLSQNVDSGELAYQPVVGRTVRPPSPTIKMTLGDEELSTTLGHPLWVSGIGWRMAKQVGESAILHGLHGPVEVDAVEPADECEAFNLVVADFNTYFVGETGILVHDNTPRRPTAAVVPGLVAE